MGGKRIKQELRLRERFCTYLPMRPKDLTPYIPPPEIAYDDHRTEIQNGDVLLYRGKGFESRIIQWATHSLYSHAGIAVWWNDRLMVMEAVGKGVVVMPLSTNVAAYRGDVEWFAAREPLSVTERHRLVAFAQRELGKDYALWKAVLLGIRILFQRDREKRDSLRREGQLFCSHYVAETYNAVGRDLKRGVSDRFMSPGDIAGSPVLVRRGALKKRDARRERWFRRAGARAIAPPH
jgi:hypothetical protein